MTPLFEPSTNHGGNTLYPPAPPAGGGPPNRRDNFGMGSDSRSGDPSAAALPEIPEVSWKIYGCMIFLAIVAFFDIGVPRIVMALLSLLLFIPLISASLRSSLPILLALVVYIPYSKAVSGNIGGIVSGLNFTTVLMVIALISAQAVSRASAAASGNGIFSPSPVLAPYEGDFRRLLIFFCILGALSVLHTDVVYGDWTFFTAFVDYKRWIDPFLIFFLFSYLVRTEREARILMTVMAVNLAIIGLGSIWQHHVISGYSHRVRLKGIADQANTMGAFYANYFFILLGFFMMKAARLRFRFLLPIGLWGIFLGLMATESRGDALALVVGVLVFFYLHNRGLFLIMAGLLIFFAVNIQFLPEGLRSRIQHTVVHSSALEISDSPTLDLSARTRLALWAGSFRMMEEHPFIGVGYKLFPELIYNYVPHNAETNLLPLKGRDAHNAYFLIGAEMGVPTLLVFLALLVNMLRVTLRSYRASIDPFWRTVSLASFCSVLSLGMTNMFGSRAISLILAGYLWAIIAILLKVPVWQRSMKANASS